MTRPSCIALLTIGVLGASACDGDGPALAVDASGRPDAAADAGAAPDQGGLVIEQVCPFPVVESTDSDLDAPALVSLTVTASAPAAGEVARLHLDVLEQGCGLAAATVASVLESDPSVRYQWRVDALTSTAVSASLMIDGCTPPGRHVIDRIVLADHAGNVSDYSPAAQPGVYERLINDETIEPTTLDVAEFAPAARAPVPQPMLRAVTAVAAPVGARVQIDASSDPSCAPVAVLVSAFVAGSQRAASGTGYFVGDRAVLDLDIAECARAGEWVVRSLVLVTSGGALVQFADSGGRYAGAGGRSNVPTAGLTLDGPPADVTSPSIDLVEVTRRVVDEGTVAVVQIATSSDECGPANGSASFRHAASDRRAYAGRLDARSSGYAGCVAIPKCAVNGAYAMEQVVTFDRGNNSTALVLRGGVYEVRPSDGATQSTPPSGTLAVTHR